MFGMSNLSISTIHTCTCIKYVCNKGINYLEIGTISCVSTLWNSSNWMIVVSGLMTYVHVLFDFILSLACSAPCFAFCLFVEACCLTHTVTD